MTKSTTAVMAALTAANINISAEKSVDFIKNDTVVISANKKLKAKLDKVMEPFMDEYKVSEFDDNMWRYTHISKTLTPREAGREIQITVEEQAEIEMEAIEKYKKKAYKPQDEKGVDTWCTYTSMI